MQPRKNPRTYGKIPPADTRDSQPSSSRGNINMPPPMLGGLPGEGDGEDNAVGLDDAADSFVLGLETTQSLNMRDRKNESVAATDEMAELSNTPWSASKPMPRNTLPASKGITRGRKGEHSVKSTKAAETRVALTLDVDERGGTSEASSAAAEYYLSSEAWCLSQTRDVVLPAAIQRLEVARAKLERMLQSDPGSADAALRLRVVEQFRRNLETIDLRKAFDPLAEFEQRDEE
ncbi:hypothetical protein P7C73_g1094, partial [Tremellales sp. Uapishka_1]